MRAACDISTTHISIDFLSRLYLLSGRYIGTYLVSSGTDIQHAKSENDSKRAKGSGSEAHTYYTHIHQVLYTTHLMAADAPVLEEAVDLFHAVELRSVALRHVRQEQL